MRQYLQSRLWVYLEVGLVTCYFSASRIFQVYFLDQATLLLLPSSCVSKSSRNSLYKISVTVQFYICPVLTYIPSTSKSLHHPFPTSFNCYYDLINLSCFLLHPLYLLLHIFSALASSEFFLLVLTTNHVFILPQNSSPISLTLWSVSTKFCCQSI